MKDKDFYAGVIWSAARIMEMHGDEVTAKDVLNEANIPRWAYMLTDQYDIDFLDGVIANLPNGNWPEELAMIYLSCDGEWLGEGDDLCLWRELYQKAYFINKNHHNPFQDFKLFFIDQFMAFKQEVEK